METTRSKQRGRCFQTHVSPHPTLDNPGLEAACRGIVRGYFLQSKRPLPFGQEISLYPLRRRRREAVVANANIIIIIITIIIICTVSSFSSKRRWPSEHDNLAGTGGWRTPGKACCKVFLNCTIDKLSNLAAKQARMGWPVTHPHAL